MPLMADTLFVDATRKSVLLVYIYAHARHAIDGAVRAIFP